MNKYLTINDIFNALSEVYSKEDRDGLVPEKTLDEFQAMKPYYVPPKGTERIHPESIKHLKEGIITDIPNGFKTRLIKDGETSIYQLFMPYVQRDEISVQRENGIITVSVNLIEKENSNPFIQGGTQKIALKEESDVRVRLEEGYLEIEVTPIKARSEVLF